VDYYSSDRNCGDFNMNKKRKKRRWIKKGSKFVYLPLFKSKVDNEVRNSLSMVCKYAGFEIHDTVKSDGGDTRSMRRWKGVPLKCIERNDVIYAQTKGMLLEKIDKRWVR